ncbi:MAG: response regulator [Burkholderiaceae bacterium]|jgi:DNA-binding NtrC family response regulator
MANILIVDDELGVRELLLEVLEDEGHAVTLAESATQARAFHDGRSYDLVLLDIWMPDTDGVTLLKEWSSQGLLTVPVVMMSGHATIDTAVEATRMGAFDFLEKPIALAKLLKTVSAALARAQAQRAWRDAVAQTQQVLGAGLVTLEEDDELDAQQGDPLDMARQALLALDLDAPLREVRESFERIVLQYQLDKEGGSMTRLAERSGLERTHLYRKIRQLGMEPHRTPTRKAAA